MIDIISFAEKSSTLTVLLPMTRDIAVSCITASSTQDFTDVFLRELVGALLVDSLHLSSIDPLLGRRLFRLGLEETAFRPTDFWLTLRRRDGRANGVALTSSMDFKFLGNTFLRAKRDEPVDDV